VPILKVVEDALQSEWIELGSKETSDALDKNIIRCFEDNVPHQRNCSFCKCDIWNRWYHCSKCTNGLCRPKDANSICGMDCKQNPVDGVFCDDPHCDDCMYDFRFGWRCLPVGSCGQECDVHDDCVNGTCPFCMEVDMERRCVSYDGSCSMECRGDQDCHGDCLYCDDVLEVCVADQGSCGKQCSGDGDCSLTCTKCVENACVSGFHVDTCGVECESHNDCFDVCSYCSAKSVCEKEGDCGTYCDSHADCTETCTNCHMNKCVD